MNEQNQCYAREAKALTEPYDNDVDVTKQFYLLCNGGLVFLLICVLFYYLQTKEGMFEMMRPYVIGINLVTLVWFISL